MTSSNGEQWTKYAAPSSNNWVSVCWSQQLNMYVSVANTGSNRVMTSSNSTTWAAHSTTGLDLAWNSVCWADNLGLFVAVAKDTGSTSIMTSSNGSNWSLSTTPPGYSWNALTWAKEIGTLIAVADTTSNIMVSKDANSWSLTSITYSNSWNGVAWSPELSSLAIVGNPVNNGNTIVVGSATDALSSISLTGNVFANVQLLANSNDSAITPGFSWNGDTKTGIYHPSACNIGFVTGGTELMRISGEGEVGIGTSTPASGLQIQSGITLSNDSTMSAYQLSVTNSNTTGERCGIAFCSENGIGGTTFPGAAIVHERTGAADTSGNLHFKTNSTGAVGGMNTRMQITSNGFVGINVAVPAYNLHVGATNSNTVGIFCEGDIAAASDERLKYNIEKISHALDKIDKINGYTYERKFTIQGVEVPSCKRMAGVLAQEVREVLPEVINEDSRGYLSVAYGNMIALLIEGIHELKNKNDELTSLVRSFNERISNIERSSQI